MNKLIRNNLIYPATSKMEWTNNRVKSIEILLLSTKKTHVKAIFYRVIGNDPNFFKTICYYLFIYYIIHI